MSAANLSVILPTYRERDNLAVLIPQIEQEFVGNLLEIVIVDDGSHDGTVELVEELNKPHNNIRIIVRPALLGIGSALRLGYNEAVGTYILSSDADLSFSVSDMRALYEKIQTGFDLVTGYRHGGGAYERTTRAVVIKYWVSNLGNKMVRAVSGVKIRDFSANFRVIRRTAWEEIKTRENTNAILFEMIVKAYRKKMRITEIPVTFSERRFGSSKLKLWKEAPKFLVKLVKYSFFDT